MQLTVRDVSLLLNISERTVYRYIQQSAIPAYKILDQYRFNRAEILEWATSRRISVSPDIFQEPESTGTPLPGLLDAIKKGGIHYRLGGATKEVVLRNVVDVMHFPEEVDRDFLFKVLLAREALSSTGIGDGIAIPHVRNPIVLNVPQSIIGLFFPENPVDFGSLDNKPVFCLFTLVSPTVRAHLHLLSKLAFALKDEGFRKTIIRQGSREEILMDLGRIETGLSGNAK